MFIPVNSDETSYIYYEKVGHMMCKWNTENSLNTVQVEMNFG